MTDDTYAKLSYLRQDAAHALREYINITFGAPGSSNLAALGYINAQARYTMACLEAKEGDILPYVEMPNEPR